jgi:ABC-2 type transport system ATP-binding protein
MSAADTNSTASTTQSFADRPRRDSYHSLGTSARCQTAGRPSRSTRSLAIARPYAPGRAAAPYQSSHHHRPKTGREWPAGRRAKHLAAAIVNHMYDTDSRNTQALARRTGAAPGRDSTTAIEVHGLSKRYGATVAVADLSFTASYGRIVGFLGPNGAGKTTTLRALLGLIRPTAGTATIDGLPYAQLADPVSIAGAMLDGGALHPGRSGRSHLRVLARAAGVPDSRAETLLSLVGLDAAAGRRAGDYSLGMRQRLGLAAALIGDPRVLVLDEPANGLDPQGIRWLRHLLRSLAAEGRAVLVSSHVLAEVTQTVDDVVVISSGRSVLQAPLEQVLAEHAAGTRVTGPDTGALGDLLRAEGAHVVGEGRGVISVRDRSEEHILRVVADRQLIVSEVSAAGSSLEEIYLQLTGNPDGGTP